MKNKEFKDGDILVSDSLKIISVLKGGYNDGRFECYAYTNAEGIILNPFGTWKDVDDWRPATPEEKEELYNELRSEVRKSENRINSIYELQKN